MIDLGDILSSDEDTKAFCEFLDAQKKELEAIGDIAKRSFYNPEIWRTNFLGVPHYNNFVEFDIDEQRMIREMVAITGRDRRDIIREGIRYLHDEVKLWDKKKTEYYKSVKVEWE